MKTRGNSLVEVVIGAAILSTVALAFLGTLSALSNFHQRNMLAIKGSLLAEEGIEALRSIKGGGWSNLSSIPLNQDSYIAVSPSAWAISSNPEVVDGLFYRSFKLTAVSRNSSDDIVTSGGSVDPSTLLATVFVAWKWKGATTTVTYKAYVTSI